MAPSYDNLHEDDGRDEDEEEEIDFSGNPILAFADGRPAEVYQT